MAKKKLPVGFEPITGVDDLAWLAEAGVDTKAIAAEWKSSPNQGEHARAAFISRVKDQHGLRTVLMRHADACLEKAIG